MSCFVAFHYRSYGTFFLHKNKLHNIYSGFTHYKYYRAKVFKVIRIYSRENKKSPSNWAFCSFET
ncbi:hypothetical protein AT980_08040 [Streptococcus pneumoniae]|nr:hypothetical protein AT980_08040 [Streptococcus pneumoniae]